MAAKQACEERSKKAALLKSAKTTPDTQTTDAAQECDPRESKTGEKETPTIATPKQGKDIIDSICKTCKNTGTVISSEESADHNPVDDFDKAMFKDHTRAVMQAISKTKVYIYKIYLTWFEF